MPDAGFLCILPFRGATGGPDRAGSAAVQAQTAQKALPGGVLGAAVWLWLLALSAGLDLIDLPIAAAALSAFQRAGAGPAL